VVETIWREKVVYTPYGSLEEEAQS
jgi:hypothetical protein